MALRFYNTLTRTVQDFTPLKDRKVGMYNCGPTVYNYATIGNFRAFMLADLLHRYLKFKGFQVTQVMNLTDVGHMTTDADEGEDKMEKAARQAGKDPWQIAEFYAQAFFADIASLRITPATVYPRATQHVPEMIELIRKLIDRGHAYTAGDGIYYSVETFPSYGQLSGNTIEKLEAGARIEVNPEKRNPADFALWKFDPKHIMQWDSPWGRGFPGWHIECSAMSMKYIGSTLDIHTGGEDNIFPHHECEIAQSEGAFGVPFVRHWLHARFLQVDGGKMAKSLGNFYTVEQLEQLGHPPVATRFALLRGHYRQVLNFTLDGLRQAAADVRRLRLFAAELVERADGAGPPEAPPAWAAEAWSRFAAGLDDDLNISAALEAVFGLLHDAHRADARGADAAAALSVLRRMDTVLGLLDESPQTLDAEVERLIEQRNAARAARDWKTADSLRDRLAELGIELLDGKDGVRWRRTGV